MGTANTQIASGAASFPEGPRTQIRALFLESFFSFVSPGRRLAEYVFTSKHSALALRNQKQQEQQQAATNSQIASGAARFPEAPREHPDRIGSRSLPETAPHPSQSIRS